jgi:hypothetical protein
MTEDEWLRDDNLNMMLGNSRGKVSRRKMRLFGCACVRQVWHLLTDERAWAAVEVAERYADRQATPKQLQEAVASIEDLRRAAAECLGYRGTVSVPEPRLALLAVVHVCHPPYENAVDEASRAAMDAWEAEYPALALYEKHVIQCRLLRDVVGNPFRRTAVHPVWLAWNDGTVPKMAQAIYEERAFDRLPILADALEDAGCTDADMLAHCRGEGEHVRGCWVVDLLLGKN